MFARRWFSQTMALLVVLIGMVGVAGAQKADPNDPHLSSLPPDLRKEYVVTPGGLLMHWSRLDYSKETVLCSRKEE